MLITERRQVAQGLGGAHWQERVTTHDGRTALPPNAVAAPDDAEECDWRPVTPQPDDRGNVPENPAAAPVPVIVGADGVMTPLPSPEE